MLLIYNPPSHIPGINYDNSEVLPPPIPSHQNQLGSAQPANIATGRHLNINVPENAVQSVGQNDAANAILRLEVELRDKHVVQNNRRPAKPRLAPRGGPTRTNRGVDFKQRNDNCIVPLEQVRITAWKWGKFERLWFQWELIE